MPSRGDTAGTVLRTVQSIGSARATGRSVDLGVALSGLLVVVSIVYVLGFLAAAYFRLTYAYPLAPMEAPVNQAVRRIVQGAALYGPPSLEYVPTLYTPLYFYVSGLLASVLGPSLLTLRLVSVAASMGSTAVIGHLVWRETGNWLMSLVAAAVFVCSTALAETSLDVARVDSLGLFFVLAGLDVARAADGSAPRRATYLGLLSGMIMGLAMLTKQTSVAPAVLIAVHAAVSGRPQRFVTFVVGAGVCVGLSAVVLGARYGAWPELYLVELPRRHSLALQRLEGFWSQQVLPSFSLPLVALPMFLIGRALDRDFAAVRFWLLATLGLLGMAWGASLNLWSGTNVVQPAFAILSAGLGLGLAEGLRRLDVPGHQARVFRNYVLVLGLVEFACIHYNPRQTSPLRSDVEAGQQVVGAIGALPGRVFAPEYPELAYQAGKGEAAFGLSVGELQGIFGGKPLPEAVAWTTEYAQALDERRYAAVLLEPDGVLPFIDDTTRDHGYVDTGPLMPASSDFARLNSHLLPALHVWVPGERAGR